MFAMAGAGTAHNDITLNVLFQLHQLLANRRCRVLSSETKICIHAAEHYAYPDVTVVCGERQILHRKYDTLMNPTVIVEVLSPSTETYDRSRKFEAYKSIESFQQYLLVSSDRVHVDLFTRQPGGAWLLRSADRLGEAIELQSLGCSLALADIYRDVDLTAAP
jgi:Uma2 family endonuclease